MSQAALRAQFLNDSVLSASPARLLTMLYDRLVLDLDRAEQSQRSGDQVEARAQLGHAQDIISELLSTLKVDAWDGAKELFSLYTYLLSETMTASVSVAPDKIAACRALVVPLREAWHEAAQSLAVKTPPARAVALAGARGDLGMG